MKLDITKEELTALFAHIFSTHLYGGVVYNEEADKSMREKVIALADSCDIEYEWNDYGYKFYGKKK